MSIELHCESESDSGHRLVLSPMSGGYVGVRVVRLNAKELDSLGKVSLIMLAGALAKSEPLTIESSTGNFRMQRTREWVHVSYCETGEMPDPLWRAKLSEVLTALKNSSRQAA